MGAKSLRYLLLSGLALGAAACQPLPPNEGPGAGEAALGLTLARSRCGRCHAVQPYGTPPHPDAPAFASIVNESGLTPGSLATWLKDAHNYPGEMQFTLEPHEVDELVAYMLTLRDPDFRPPI